MISLNQSPPGPIISITLSRRAVATGLCGQPVVTGTVTVVDGHGQIVLQWFDDDIDQTLHDMAAKGSFDTGGIDFEIIPNVDSEWLTVQATEGRETRHLQVKEFDYFDLIAEAMKENATWSDGQPGAEALENHRRGI
jgi:hypothetical protein